MTISAFVFITRTPMCGDSDEGFPQWQESLKPGEIDSIGLGGRETLWPESPVI
jgi:hypothetical protein